MMGGRSFEGSEEGRLVWEIGMGEGNRLLYPSGGCEEGRICLHGGYWLVILLGVACS